MPGPIAVKPEFTIIDESDDWLVVNKAAPLLVHATGNPNEVTLSDGLEQLLSFDVANGNTPALIHRLDRETSGVMLVAKNIEWTRRFNQAMEERRFRKTYHAIVHGHPDWPDQSCTCEAPLLRAGEVEPSEVYVRQCVHHDGQSCHTDFKLLKSFHHRDQVLSFIEAHPKTGRTHQIRVHLSYLGHPIVGDKIYGDNGITYQEFLRLGTASPRYQSLLLTRQALHASELSIDLPGLRRTWRAPLAAEIASLISR